MDKGARLPNEDAPGGSRASEESPRPEDLLSRLEALLFVSPEPVTLRQIQVALDGADRESVRAALGLLAQSLQGSGERGLLLQEVGGGYRLVTKPELDACIRAFSAQRKKQRLSPAARETLAIVAYKQPITAPEIADIRGVDAASAVKSLLERRLIRILGRKEVVGRPILYGTTKEFLIQFGLKGLEDLPTLEDFNEMSAGLVSAGSLDEPLPEGPESRDIQAIQEARELREAMEDGEDEEE